MASRDSCKPVLRGRQFRWCQLMLAAGLAMMLAGQVGAANLAPLGDAILGVNDAIDADAGTSRYSAGVLANLNDGNLNTRVDNCYGGNAEVYSYVGVLWLRTRCPPMPKP